MGLLFVDQDGKDKDQIDKNASYKLIHGPKSDGQKSLDKTYIGLNGMWTKNNGTKIIWTKLTFD